MAMSPSHIPPDGSVLISDRAASTKEGRERCSKCGRLYRKARNKISATKSTADASGEMSKSQGGSSEGAQETVEQVVITRKSRKGSKKSKKHSHRKSLSVKQERSTRSSFSKRMERRGLRKVILTMYRDRRGKFVKVPRRH